MLVFNSSSLIEDLHNRSNFIKFMKNKRIYCLFDYVSLHNSPMGTQISINKSSQFPVLKDISKRIFRIMVRAWK